VEHGFRKACSTIIVGLAAAGRGVRARFAEEGGGRRVEDGFRKACSTIIVGLAALAAGFVLDRRAAWRRLAR
jgi:hypothetical protein